MVVDFNHFLYLSRADIVKCDVSWDLAMEVAEMTYVEHSKGAYEMPPKPGVHPTNCAGAFLHAMPGYLPGLEICGLKWVTMFGHNPKKYGVKAISGLMILNDVETGYPLAVMEAGLITAIRTATSSGVSVKYLANKNAEVVGLIGAGEQGRNNMELIKHVHPNVKVMKIFDRYPDFAQKLADDMKEKLGVDAYIVNSAEEAIRDSDILVAAAPVTVKEPVYLKEWIKPGCLILPVHSKGWDYDLFANNKFIADDWNQYSSDMFNPKTGYFGSKGYEKFPLYAELGEIVSGKKVGRTSEDEIIVSANMGIALQDLSLGLRILEKAQELGLGITLDA